MHRNLPRRVRRIVGNVAEERLIRPSIVVHEVDSRVRQNVSDETLSLDRFPIAFQFGVEVIIPMPGAKSEELLKSLTIGGDSGNALHCATYQKLL